MKHIERIFRVPQSALMLLMVAAGNMANAGSFSPKDSRPISIYGADHQAVIQYQHHLDFYTLPDSMTVRRKSPHARIEIYDSATKKSIGVRNLADLNRRPDKVVTFRNQIQLSRFGPSEWHFVWACDSVLELYSPSDKAEEQILKEKYPNGYRLRDESSQEKEFCGAIGLDGKILYRLPRTQNPPHTIFSVGPTTPDGQVVIISVGSFEEVKNEDGEVFQQVGHIREALVWTTPDKLETIQVKDAAQVNALLSTHGQNVSGAPWPWKMNQ